MIATSAPSALLRSSSPSSAAYTARISSFARSPYFYSFAYSAAPSRLWCCPIILPLFLLSQFTGHSVLLSQFFSTEPPNVLLMDQRYIRNSLLYVPGM